MVRRLKPLLHGVPPRRPPARTATTNANDRSGFRVTERPRMGHALSHVIEAIEQAARAPALAERRLDELRVEAGRHLAGGGVAIDGGTVDAAERGADQAEEQHDDDQ